MDILHNIINEIDSSLNSSNVDYIDFGNSNCTSLKLSPQNFHKILPQNSDKKLCFIDGGNSELIKAPNLSLHFIRLGGVVFQNNKRVLTKKTEYYALITTTIKNDRIYYKTKFFGTNLLDEANFVFDSYDKTISNGANRADISLIGEIVRKFAEISFASECIDVLDNGDFIVLDNALKASITNEGIYFNRLYEKAVAKGVIVSGLTKTTQLLTKTGDSIIGYLNNISPEGAWYYYPVLNIEDKEHPAEMFFVKLHKSSSYIFRFEIYKKQYNDDANIIFPLLALNSKDPVFLGYPYGLLYIDRISRVSNHESELLKAKLSVIGNKISNKLKKYQNAVNAHDILDNIS